MELEVRDDFVYVAIGVPQIQGEDRLIFNDASTWQLKGKTNLRLPAKA